MNDIKMAGKKHNLKPMWKRLMKHVNLEKPTIPEEMITDLTWVQIYFFELKKICNDCN